MKRNIMTFQQCLEANRHAAIKVLMPRAALFNKLAKLAVRDADRQLRTHGKTRRCRG